MTTVEQSPSPASAVNQSAGGEPDVFAQAVVPAVSDPTVLDAAPGGAPIGRFVGWLTALLAPVGFGALWVLVSPWVAVAAGVVAVMLVYLLLRRLFRKGRPPRRRALRLNWRSSKTMKSSHGNPLRSRSGRPFTGRHGAGHGGSRGGRWFRRGRPGTGRGRAGGSPSGSRFGRVLSRSRAGKSARRGSGGARGTLGGLGARIRRRGSRSGSAVGASGGRSARLGGVFRGRGRAGSGSPPVRGFGRWGRRSGVGRSVSRRSGAGRGGISRAGQRARSAFRGLGVRRASGSGVGRFRGRGQPRHGRTRGQGLRSSVRRSLGRVLPKTSTTNKGTRKTPRALRKLLRRIHPARIGKGSRGNKPQINASTGPMVSHTVNTPTPGKKTPKNHPPMDDMGFDSPAVNHSNPSPFTTPLMFDDGGFPINVPPREREESAKVPTSAQTVQAYTETLDHSTAATQIASATHAADRARISAAQYQDKADHLRAQAAGLSNKEGMQGAAQRLLAEAAAAEKVSGERRGMAAAFEGWAAEIANTAQAAS